jgi:pimeloyl-ACP methyl ester carboxylesterase
VAGVSGWSAYAPGVVSRPAGTRRWRRRLRRAAYAALATLLTLTIASVLANALTVPPATLAPDGGSDVQVGGVRVHYRHWGPAGPPILLVHGFAESSATWGPTVDLLARDHQVYAVDLAGYGYTDYTGRYALEDQVALVDGTIHALHLDRPVVIGHSLGAAVVGALALAHPGDIRGVIFADGDGLPFPGQDVRRVPPRWIYRLPYLTTAYRLGTRWDRLSSLLVRAQCGSVCRGLTPALVEAWMRPLRQGEAERALPAIAATGILHLTPEQIRRIDIPRGIIWGAEDATSGGSLAGAKANLGEPPTIVLAHAAHLAQIADPEGWAAAVRHILSTWPASGSV